MWSDVLDQFGGSLRAEWGKAWSVRVPTYWLVATVTAALLTAASLANDFVLSLAQGELPAGSRLAVVDVLAPALGVAQLLAAAYAIHLVTPEYASRSIVSTFIAEPRRWVVLMAKATTAVATCSVLGAALGPVLVREIELIGGGSTGARPSLLAASTASALVLMCAAAVGLALAFLMRSAVAALCVSLLLLVATLFAPEAIGHLLPGPAARSLVEDLAAGTVEAGPLVVLVVWTSALLCAAAWLVDRRDA
jgi:hypothetical protein